MLRSPLSLLLVALSATGLCSCHRWFSYYSSDGAPIGGDADDDVPESCGDGTVNPPEQCDDGQNGDPCDGCLDTCQTHINLCGDALRCGEEVCDNGINDGDLGNCAVDCSAGPPARLSFLREPSDGTAGNVIYPNTSVLIEDADGRRVRGASVGVTLILGVDPTDGVATLTGNGPVAAIDGLAVFPSLTLDTAGTGYVLDAVSATLVSASSVAFTIESPETWPPVVDEWQYRKRIVIPSRSPSASLDDFPLLINFESDADLRARAHSEGYDIRFTDSSDTLLPHESESFDGGTGALLAWVRIPILDTSDETTLFMYYGNAAATTDPNDPSVWSNGYVGVWHLAEIGSGEAGEYHDATGNGNGATGGDGVASCAPTRQPAAIGMGQSGDGVDDIITTPVSINVLERSSISLWVYLRDVTNTARPGLVGQNNALEIGLYWSDRINAWTPGMTVMCPDKGIPSLCTPDFPMTTWFHLAVSWDGTEGVMYVDGVERHRVPAATGSSAGAFNMMGRVYDAVGNHLDGILDEVRLVETDRSGSWFEHEHANQNDPGSFYIVGPEERRP